jgi:hypothetical protein
MRDRLYLHWVFEAKKRFGLSVLNYTVTSNHIHLLVKDTGANVICSEHAVDRWPRRAGNLGVNEIGNVKKTP